MSSSYRKVQKITKEDKLLAPIKLFHNHIKEINYRDLSGKTIIELAAGHLNDLNRWAKSGIKKVIAIEIDDSSVKLGQKIYNDTLLKNIEKRKKDLNIKPLPEVIYIRADINEQLDGITKIIYEQLGNKIKVDHIFCHFAIHYFMESKKTIDNLIKLLDTFLAIDGTFRFTCIDGKILFNQFKDILTSGVSKIIKGGKEEIKFFDLKPIVKMSKEPSIESTASNTISFKKGSKELFKIKRLYDEDETFQKYGQKVSVFVTSIGKSHTEYLVNIDHFVKECSNYRLIKLNPFGEYLKKYQGYKLSEAEYRYSNLHVYIEMVRFG